MEYYGSTGYLEEEIATLETKIKKTNIGYSMLSKLGWKEGEGLGAHGTGKVFNQAHIRELIPLVQGGRSQYPLRSRMRGWDLGRLALIQL